jgi:hypothetical protein
MNRTRPYRTCAGRICWNCLKLNLSLVHAGQNVGVKQVSDGIWLVSLQALTSSCSGWGVPRSANTLPLLFSRATVVDFLGMLVTRRVWAPLRSRVCLLLAFQGR